MTARKLIVAAVLLGATLGAMPAAFAQGYYGAPYGRVFHHYYGRGGSLYHEKGGPGPRVLDGRGAGAGAESGTAW
jgi:hypothetical protein